MRVLVSDTSVLIDLERGRLLETVFRSSVTLAVPDLLFEQELRPYNGDHLLSLGLEVLNLEAEGVGMAMAYRSKNRLISLPDSFALALAKIHGYTLLTGDGALSSLAKSEDVDCHGVLWVMDLLELERVAAPRQLFDALTALANHPRCRLPRKLIAERLKKYQTGHR